jgi:hypothetical protein
MPSSMTYAFTSPTATDSGDASISPSDFQREITAQITRLVRLAQLCSHSRLLGTMVGLLRQLMSSNLKYAHLAMTLADEHDLRALRGAAYLEVMQKAIVVPRSPPFEDENEANEGKEGGGGGGEESRVLVNPAQQLRLLSGYYRLTGVWERLRLSPPPFDHAPSCGATWHQHGCTQSWTDFWKEKSRSDAVLNLGLADVIGRLRAIQKEFDRWGSATYMHHDCRMAARRCIQERIKAVEDKLPDYFTEEGTSG